MDQLGEVALPQRTEFEDALAHQVETLAVTGDSRQLLGTQTEHPPGPGRGRSRKEVATV